MRGDCLLRRTVLHGWHPALPCCLSRSPCHAAAPPSCMILAATCAAHHVVPRRQLYEVLSQPALAKRRAPVLLACNKQDLGCVGGRVARVLLQAFACSGDRPGCTSTPAGLASPAALAVPTSHRHSAACTGPGMLPARLPHPAMQLQGPLRGLHPQAAGEGAGPGGCWVEGAGQRCECKPMPPRACPMASCRLWPLTRTHRARPPLRARPAAAAQHAGRAQRRGRRRRRRRAVGRARRAFHFRVARAGTRRQGCHRHPVRCGCMHVECLVDA